MKEELDIFIDIDTDWFKWWKHSYYPTTRTDIRSVTSLYSPHLLDDSEKFHNGNWTTALTFGTFMDHPVRRNEKRKNCLILFSVFPRSVLNPNQVVMHANNLCCNYLNNAVKEIEGISPSCMIVPSDELKNNLIVDIRKNKADVPVRRFKYLEHGKTLDNMLKRAIQRISEKRIYVMADPITPAKLRNQDSTFIRTIQSYPSLESKCIVWCLVQTVLFLEDQGFFQDKPERKEISRPIRPFYGLDNIS